MELLLPSILRYSVAQCLIMRLAHGSNWNTIGWQPRTTTGYSAERREYFLWMTVANQQHFNHIVIEADPVLIIKLAVVWETNCVWVLVILQDERESKTIQIKIARKTWRRTVQGARQLWFPDAPKPPVRSCIEAYGDRHCSISQGIPTMHSPGLSGNQQWETYPILFHPNNHVSLNCSHKVQTFTVNVQLWDKKRGFNFLCGCHAQTCSRSILDSWHRIFQTRTLWQSPECLFVLLLIRRP